MASPQPSRANARTGRFSGGAGASTSKPSATEPGPPTVVFHHGYGAYSALYTPFLVQLAGRGINVVALDRPGHGLSDGRRGDCTVAELAEITRLVIEREVAPRSRPVM